MFNLISKVYAAQAGNLNINDFSPLNPIRSGDLGQMIVNILNKVLWFAGIIAVVYLIYGGLLYITAGGDAEKATKGRTAIINAIIGVAIILLSILILSYVTKTIK